MLRSCLCSTALLLFAAPSLAQTPFPEFTGERLYISGVPDIYQSLKPEIERLEESSPQTYYLVVVQSTGSGQSATRDYLDRMYQSWLVQADRKRLPIDPNRSVIILLAMENRQLSIKTGTLLQNQYGLRDQVLDRDFAVPHFVPHAKAGNHAEGLRNLLTQLNQHIVAKDAAIERQQQEAAARAAEIEQNAKSTLASARQLLGEVRTELDAKKSSGLDIGKFETQAAQAGERLDKLDAAVPGQGVKVLHEAHEAQRQLQDVQTHLRQLAALQKQAEEQLHQVKSSAQELKPKLQTHRENKLATERLETRLEEVFELIEMGELVVPQRPNEAMAVAENAAQYLSVLKSEMEQLPQLASQTEERFAIARRQRSELEQQIQRATQIGADTRTSQEWLKQFDEGLAKLLETMQSDYSPALAWLELSQPEMSAHQQQVANAYHERFFLTRTLPITSISIAVAVVALVLGFLRWRHVRMQHRLVKSLESFRADVTRWMEQLDKLKERHQFLPFTDKDFSEPMTGRTLELYQQVEASYAQLRSQWLAMMDRRTKAESVFELERPLSVGRFKEVQSLLEAREDATQLEPGFKLSVEQLDRLNQAHERATQAEQTAAALRNSAAGLLQSLDEAKLPARSLAARWSAEDAAIQQAIAMLRSDPLSALAAFEQAERALQELNAAAQRRLKCVAQWQAVQKRRDEVSQRSIELRAGGLRLKEELADPDPPLRVASDQLAAAWSALEQEDDSKAETATERGRKLVAEGIARIDRHLADKEFCCEQAPKLREALAQLQASLTQAGEQQQELQAQFDPESWSPLAQNLPQATAISQAVATHLEEATRAAGNDIQEYCRAADILREAELQRHKAAALVQAIAGGLVELTRLRTSAQSRLAEVDQSERRVAALFAAQERIVGQEARQQWSQARQAAQQAAAGAQRPQPHWPRVILALDQASQAFASAHARADEDVRRHQQVLAELNQARAGVSSVGQLLRSSSADRPRANQRFQAAQQAIERIEQASGQSGAPWAALLEQLKQAIGDLDQARRWADEDIRLAQQATAALASAEREFHQSRTFVGFGVSANLAAAESQLAQARQRLGIQDYEQSIALADSAERAARQAHLEAVREADERRRQQEAERQRREAEHAARNASIMSAMASSSASSSMASSPSRASNTSTSSWSSGTSQTSW